VADGSNTLLAAKSPSPMQAGNMYNLLGDDDNISNDAVITGPTATGTPNQ